MTTPRLIAVAACLLSSCSTSVAPAPLEISLPNRSVLVIAGVPGSVVAQEPERVAVDLGDGLRLVVQSIPVSDRLDDDRDANAVAAALVERVELAERDGELLHSRCTVAQSEGECLRGWMSVNGTRFARSGGLVRAGENIVWLDVSGPATVADAVSRRSSQILESAHFRAAEGGDAS